MRKKAIVVATSCALLSMIGPRASLAQQECRKLGFIAEYVNVADPQVPTDIRGLNGASAVAISPDGACVYAVSDVDDAIVAFARDTGTGALSFVEAIADGADFGLIDGLNGAADVVVTADNGSGNAYVYVAGEADDRIAVFEQQTNSCALDFITATSHNAINGPRQLALSADGLDLFVANGGGAGTLVVLTINGNGTLSSLQSFTDGIDALCLAGASGVTASADGNCIYVAAASDDAVCVFGRDPGSGLLSPTQNFNAGSGATLLNDPRRVAASNDNKNVYVTAHASDAITVTTRQAPSFFDPAGCNLGLTQEITGATLNGALGVAVHPSDTRVYVAAELYDGIAFYQRDTGTGQLTNGATFFDAARLNGVSDAATDGTHLYTANSVRDSVAAFEVDDCCGDHVVQTNETCDASVCCTSDCTTPINLGASCDADANLCTAGDTCDAAGKCVAGPCAIGAVCDKPCNGGPGHCGMSGTACLCQ